MRKQVTHIQRGNTEKLTHVHAVSIRLLSVENVKNIKMNKTAFLGENNGGGLQNNGGGLQIELPNHLEMF